MNFNHDTGAIDTILTIDTTQSPPLGGTTGILQIVGTGAIGLPVGTTGERPANAAGLLRYSSTNGGPEFNNGSGWSAMGGSVTSVAATGSTGLVVGGSPVTTSGTLTFTLGTELQGLSGLAANGMVTRTASGTYAARTVTGTASNILVTNGDGVAGNPTINLATAGSAISDQFVRITTDTFGRVTASAGVSAGNITTALGYTPINKAGDTGIGALSLNSAASITLAGGGTVTGLPSTPAGSTDAASKAYVDSVAQGLDPKSSVRVATIAAGTLATSFANGQTVDGQTLVTGDRILIKNQGTASENGIYTVNVSGAPTRATDMDAWTEVPGAFVFVEIGSLADTGWVCTADQGGTINSTAITFAQFGGAGTYTAGTGLTLTGTAFSLTSPVTTALGGTNLTTIGTANQVLGVNNGATGLEYKTVASGTAISVAHTANTITVNNTGVTSAVAGTGIGVSGGTGAVTFTNSGVTALSGTTNQITASASTGSVTLSTPTTFVAPGYVQVTTGLYQSTSAAVSAAGTTQGTGTALTASYNVVTTVGANSGVVLPVPVVSTGWSITVVNRGANPLNVYPNSGAAIDGASTNVAVVVPVNDTITLQNSSATQWFTTQPVDIAGTGISVTLGNGVHTITNTGVTSAVAGTGISVSSGTGAVTISNTGVTSVGLSLPSFITVSGSPVTTTGTLTGTLASQTANTVLIAPNGSAGAPTFRALVLADLPIKLYGESSSTPTAPTASGTNTVAIGSGSAASGTGTFAVGDGSSAGIFGEKSFANGKFATAGDAQCGMYVVRNITSNNTATELYLDGVSATQRMVIPNNSVWTFHIMIAGRRTDAVGGGAGYKFEGAIRKDTTVGSTTIIGATSKAILGETNTAWDATVTADTTNGSLKITVTGENAKTIRWVATVITTEVTN